MVHAQVYDLAEDARHRLDQRDQRPEGRACAGAKRLGDRLLDVRQPLGAEGILDGVANVGDSANKVIKHLYARRAKDVAHNSAYPVKVIPQDADHGDDSADTRDDRAKCAKQRHEPARQWSHHSSAKSEDVSNAACDSACNAPKCLYGGQAPHFRQRSRACGFDPRHGS